MLSREGRPARIPPDVSCIAAASAPAVPRVADISALAEAQWRILSGGFRRNLGLSFQKDASAACVCIRRGSGGFLLQLGAL